MVKDRINSNDVREHLKIVCEISTIKKNQKAWR